MTIPLPEEFTPHVAKVRPLVLGGGMGDSWGTERDLPGFTEDEQKKVTESSGAEVISSTQHYVSFDEVVPIGSIVTVWPGLTGERDARVISIGRHQHADLPSYQTLFLE